MHRETRIANYTFAAFAIISLTLMSLPLAGPVQAFKACLTYVLNPFAYYGDKGAERLSNVPARVRGLLSAELENRLMREEASKAVWTKSEADSLRVENARLRAELGLKPRGQHQPLWARVMERDPAHWYRSLLVDAGEKDGVAVNAPVFGMAGGALGVVGRVVEARPDSSVVLLLTDELSSVAAYLASASTTTPKSLEGLLQGQGAARLRMNYLAPDAALEKGDLVFTSPTSATFPPDVLLGVVSSVFPLDPFLTFQSVEVAPAVDGSALKEVMILKPMGSRASLAQPVKPQTEVADR